MALSQAELMQDIQAEIGESSAESVNITGYLTDCESCETMEELKMHLLDAQAAALSILGNIQDQIARLI